MEYADRAAAKRARRNWLIRQRKLGLLPAPTPRAKLGPEATLPARPLPSAIDPQREWEWIYEFVTRGDGRC